MRQEVLAFDAHLKARKTVTRGITQSVSEVTFHFPVELDSFANLVANADGNTHVVAMDKVAEMGPHIKPYGARGLETRQPVGQKIRHASDKVG